MSKPKRYLLFTYDTYYPGGGWCDFDESFDTIDELVDYLKDQNTKADNHNIIDLETGDYVYLDD